MGHFFFLLSVNLPLIPVTSTLVLSFLPERSGCWYEACLLLRVAERIKQNWECYQHHVNGNTHYTPKTCSSASTQHRTTKGKRGGIDKNCSMTRSWTKTYLWRYITGFGGLRNTEFLFPSVKQSGNLWKTMHHTLLKIESRLGQVPTRRL